MSLIINYYYTGGLYVTSTTGTSYHFDPDIAKTKKIKKWYYKSLLINYHNYLYLLISLKKLTSLNLLIFL